MRKKQSELVTDINQLLSKTMTMVDQVALCDEAFALLVELVNAMYWESLIHTSLPNAGAEWRARVRTLLLANGYTQDSEGNFHAAEEAK